MNELIYSSPFLMIYVLFVAGLLGMVMGSCLNCFAIRMVKKEPFSKGRSHCVSCNHVLGPLDLIPIVSWIFLKGKCRYCGEKISVKYPLTELVSCIVFITVTLKYGFTAELAEMLIFFSILLLVSFTDIEGYIIPDKLILAGIILRIVYIVFSGGNILSSLWEALLGGLSISLPLLVIILILEKITGREAMGGGDIKLFFMTGMYFSYGINFLAFLAACLIGILAGIIILKKKSPEDGHIPFGPSIAAGVYIAAMIGKPLIEWYLGLF